jgi:hypothetical protein
MNPHETYFNEIPEWMRANHKLRGKRKTRTNTDFMSVFNTGFVESACGRGRNKRLTLPVFLF